MVEIAWNQIKISWNLIFLCFDAWGQFSVVVAAFRARALWPCTVRALYVHCACTVKTHTRTHTCPAEAGNIEDFTEARNGRRRKTERDCERHVSVYVYELALSHRGCEESRKDFYNRINTYVLTYILTDVHTYVHTYIQPYMGTCSDCAARPENKKTRLLQTVDGKNPAPPNTLGVLTLVLPS